MCFSEKLYTSNNFQQMKQKILIILLMTYAPENIDADIYITIYKSFRRCFEQI